MRMPEAFSYAFPLSMSASKCAGTCGISRRFFVSITTALGRRSACPATLCHVKADCVVAGQAHRLPPIFFNVHRTLFEKASLPNFSQVQHELDSLGRKAICHGAIRRTAAAGQNSRVAKSKMHLTLRASIVSMQRKNSRCERRDPSSVQQWRADDRASGLQRGRSNREAWPERS